MKKFYRNVTTALTMTLVLALFPNTSAWATHNRAGEITLKQISDLTYEITITTFTYTLSAADRNQLEVEWGDNSTSIAPRRIKEELPDFYRHNVYIAQHTFPGPGTYQIVVQDPNRNYGVRNIPNSVNVIFSVKTILTINPGIGEDSTPILLNPPIDKAALGQIFIHNPAAFDFEGDSLSYSLTPCTEEDGKPIENYTVPKASDTLYVNPVTGDLVWDTPVDSGIYNIAMNISEWRNGVKIGNVARDMQIEVYRTNNHPPVNDSLPDFCIMAGTRFEQLVHSTDPDGDNLTHFITGGPYAYQDSSIYDTIVSKSPGQITSRIIWQTSCLDPRNQPYLITIKTEDHNPELSLIDIDNLKIKVLAPPPQLLDLLPSNNSVNILWNKYECANIQGYKIYRKEGSSNYTHDDCTPGLPSSTGFELVGKTTTLNDTVFNDDNKGNGLSQGTEYCYRVTAILSDGSESFPSDEMCTSLVPGSPSLLNASVEDPGENGTIFISWAKPLGLDTIPGVTGPYQYIIYRSDDLWGKNLKQIYSFNTSDLNDTTYTDQPVNTLVFPYSYQVELYNNAPGNHFLIGKPEIASTVYPEVNIGDNKIFLNFKKNVPWVNTSYVIYRLNNNTGIYDSIAVTGDDHYTDTNLTNGTQYCYYAVSKGFRDNNGIHYQNSNISHRACGIPGDTIPPCPPDLTVHSACDSLFNQLSWGYNDSIPDCAVDIVKYKIYYTPQVNINYTVIDSLKGIDQTSYNHYPVDGLAGCYYVTAIDSFGNESQPSVKVCVDECIKYEIPNVFSPNGDGVNDILKPYAYRDVHKIDMKIYNRWGQLIYKTQDPDINWDGKIQGTNKLAAPGVYYYICDVYEKRITGIEVRNMVGFIHLYHEKGAKNDNSQQNNF